MVFRKPTPDEARLLARLASIAGIDAYDQWLSGLQVADMDDGGMGSLQLRPAGAGSEPDAALITRQVAVQFTDDDGVEVIASLNFRKDGLPFELDIWKTDYSPLIRIPDVFYEIEN